MTCDLAHLLVTLHSHNKEAVWMADDMRLLMRPNVGGAIPDGVLDSHSEAAPSEAGSGVTSSGLKSSAGGSDAVSEPGSNAATTISKSSKSGSGTPARKRAPAAKTRRTYASVLSEKHDLLFKMNRMLARGGKQSRSMSAADSVDELRAECDRMQREIDTEKSIKFQRSVMLSFATGVECLNSKFDLAGVRLDGWSESLQQDIGSFDEVFEELHQKYGGKSMMPPELKLVVMVASSAFMFHMSKSMFSGIPGMQDAMRDDPELAKAVAAAVARKAGQNHAAPPEQRGAANMFASVLGGGRQAGGGNVAAKSMTPPNDDDSVAGVERLFSDSEDETASQQSSDHASRGQQQAVVDDDGEEEDGSARGLILDA